MPLYEYVCNRCDIKFEMLRPTARMDDAAACPSGHTKSTRVLSPFSAMTKDPYGGEVAPVGGGGGCGGCAGGCSCGAN